MCWGEGGKNHCWAELPRFLSLTHRLRRGKKKRGAESRLIATAKKGRESKKNLAYLRGQSSPGGEGKKGECRIVADYPSKKTRGAVAGEAYKPFFLERSPKEKRKKKSERSGVSSSHNGSAGEKSMPATARRLAKERKDEATMTCDGHSTNQPPRRGDVEQAVFSRKKKEGKGRLRAVETSPGKRKGMVVAPGPDESCSSEGDPRKEKKERRCDDVPLDGVVPESWAGPIV